MVLWQDNVTDEQADAVLDRAVVKVRAWVRNPKGKAIIVPVIIGDAFCNVKLEVVGTWSEMQKEQAAANIRYIFKDLP